MCRQYNKISKENFKFSGKQVNTRVKCLGVQFVKAVGLKHKQKLNQVMG